VAELISARGRQSMQQKQHFVGRQLHINEEAEMAADEWLWMQKGDFCCGGIF
jgi:hypothetical protein